MAPCRIWSIRKHQEAEGLGDLGQETGLDTRSRETWELSDLGEEDCGRWMLPGWERLPYVTLGEEERGVKAPPCPLLGTQHQCLPGIDQGQGALLELGMEAASGLCT